MAEISVARADGDEYEVTVWEPGGETAHRVTVTDDDLAWLGVEGSAEEVLTESFRFLLEREPKEAILRRFGLRTIARYFSEYREAMGRRVGAG